MNTFRLMGTGLMITCTITTIGVTGDAATPVEETSGSSAEEASTATTPPSGSSSANDATGNWGGWRDKLKQKGFSFGINWIGEGFKNFQGGKNTADLVGASTLDLNLTVDTEKAFDWPGGKFYIDLEDHAGQNPSTVLTGDLQVFDKLNSSPYLQVFELYYEQKLFHDLLRVKVGKVDANSEFSVIDNGLDFIDSSTQVTPTLLAFPTTPDPLPGLNVFLTPFKAFYASFGAYLANQRDHFLDFTGSPWDVQPTRDGTLFIGETGFKWTRTPLLLYDGNLKVGFWGHTGTFSRLDVGYRHGADGFYAILDQTLWKPTDKEDDARGVRTFLEYGRTDPSVSTIFQHTGGGITWVGPLSQRPEDELGFSPEYAYLSKEANLSYSYELILESFYKVKLGPWAMLQPDLQCIVHPGGKYPDALVGTLWLSLQF